MRLLFKSLPSCGVEQCHIVYSLPYTGTVVALPTFYRCAEVLRVRRFISEPIGKRGRTRAGTLTLPGICEPPYLYCSTDACSRHHGYVLAMRVAIGMSMVCHTGMSPSDTTRGPSTKSVASLHTRIIVAQIACTDTATKCPIDQKNNTQESKLCSCIR